MGDKLVVGLTTDAAVGKSGRPVMDWDSRAIVLAELRCVDEVIPCASGVEAIRKVHPAVFVKGTDYESSGLLPGEIEICRLIGCQIRFTTSAKRSTTELIERIRRTA